MIGMTRVRSFSIAHMRYIKILTSWIRGFWVKIANFYHSTISQFPEETCAQMNQTKYKKMTRKPRSHVRILILYRTWAIPRTTISEPETGLRQLPVWNHINQKCFFFLRSQNDFDSDWLKSITNNCKVDYNGDIKTAENPTFCPSWHSVHSWSGRHFVPNYILKVAFHALE